jgi:concanavalin A-like lectin/glucanase superfamily protein
MTARIGSDRPRRGRLLKIRALGLALAALALAPAAQAQPFGGWATFQGPTSGYVRVNPSPALNPTAAFTFEAWVNVTDPLAGGCSSIAGKHWQKAWWIGICGTTLRSYVKGYAPAGLGGTGTFRDAGVLPPGTWTHIAVVFDGAQRLHYINGELAGSWAESGPLTTSTEEVRIGSDIAYVHTPAGSIHEVRLWNVARTEAQIRAWLNKRITVAQPGLVSVWSLGGTNDIIGGHNGAVMGSGVGALTFPPGGSCTTTVGQLCLQGRFIITTKWRTNPTPGTPPNGNGSVVVAGPNSGVFWFFSSDNWEVMVKAINACPLNNRYWIYSAALTDVFYRMEVFDNQAKAQKIYFNYPGLPAPAVTDSDAFATCP